MANSGRKAEIIVKRVNKQWTEEDIKTDLESCQNGFSEPFVKRFVKRNGEVLNTVKITLKSHTEYVKATRLGIFINGEHFKVETFQQQPKAHQCYNCKHFGHPAKWCVRKLRCEYCSAEGHAGRDCIVRGETHEYRCSNCKGQHSSTYYQCPEYIKHLRRPESTTQEEYGHN